MAKHLSKDSNREALWPSAGRALRLSLPACLLGAAALALAGFAAGRLTTAPAAQAPTVRAVAAHGPDLGWTQGPARPGDARELIPLPGPGDVPGMPSAEGECPLYLYQDGRLFRLPAPGQRGDGPPGPGGSPELFPLEPLPSPPRPTPPGAPRPPGFGPGERIVEAAGSGGPPP